MSVPAQCGLRPKETISLLQRTGSWLVFPIDICMELVKPPAPVNLCLRSQRHIHSCSYLRFTDVKTTLKIFSGRSCVKTFQQIKVHTRDVQLFSCSAYLQPYYQQLIWFQLDCRANCPVSQATLINSNIRLEKCIHVLEMCDETISKPVGKCKLLIRNLQNKRCYRFQLIVVDIQEYLVAGEWKPQTWSQHNSRISSMHRQLFQSCNLV